MIDYTTGLPSGIDFSNPNWSVGLDLSKIDAFKGLNNLGLGGVNDGRGNILYLPVGWIAQQQHEQAAPPRNTAPQNTAPALQGNLLNPTTPGPGGFADYLNQIGVHNAPATAPSSGGGDSWLGGIMSGFAGMRHIRSASNPLGNGASGSASPYYNSFLQYVAANPVASNPGTANPTSNPMAHIANTLPTTYSNNGAFAMPNRNSPGNYLF